MTTTRLGIGPISTAITVDVGDFLIVSAGGIADATVVNSGGQVYLSSGGTTNGTVLFYDGTEYVSSGGMANFTTATGGGFELVYTGGTATETVVSAGGDQSVYSGGTAISARIASGGTQLVYSSGTASGTVVEVGGTEIVYGGGTAIGTVVSGEGLQNVSAGGTASGGAVGSGGVMQVFSGGTAAGVTVGSGGSEIVSAGGIDSNATIESGGFLVALPGADVTQATGPVTSSGVVVLQPGIGVLEFTSVAIDTVIVGLTTENILKDGIAVATLVSDGGGEFVYDAGTASGTVVGISGSEFVSSGGTTNGTVLNSGGQQFVYSSGTASGTEVTLDGREYVSSGGVAIAAVVSGGGEDLVSAGGTASGTTLSGGIEGVYGTSIATMVSSGGQQYLLAGGSASFTGVRSGGAQIVLPGGSATDTTVSSGGTQIVYLGGTASGTSVQIGGTIDALNLPYVSGGSAGIDPANDMLVVSQGGQSFSQQLSGNYAREPFQIAPDTGSGTLITLACFAAGTRIATDAGEAKVETLRPGDRVLSVFGGSAPVVWVGHRRVDCRRHPRPEEVWPVRIAAHAFGPGRPGRDLRLSPDHAVYVDGVLIPVRYLVNGVSIAQQRVTEITYWHVELDRHNVILANGLPAESYLDTGNRAAFANGGAAPIMAHPDFARRVWTERGCAPLVLTGRRIEHARRQLLARAAALGHATTEAPDLCVMASGRVLPLAVDGRSWRVRLPPAARDVRIRSRIWIPAHIQPAGNDFRRLGVALAGIRLDGRQIDLVDGRLSSGWHDPEPNWRWTDGDAGLAVSGERELAFEVAISGSYWLTEPAESPMTRRANGRFSRDAG